MARTTGIEWTDATWNPIRGCSRVSEGCRNCYAEVVANRFCGPGKPYEGVVQIGADGKGNGKWNGQIKFVEKHLLDPLRMKTPSRIFVNSMSDLFHENVTDEMLDQIFAVMALCPRHTFQVLTKRPERMLGYMSRPSAVAVHWISIAASLNLPIGLEGKMQPIIWPLPNVHLGVSVEDQKAVYERIPPLLQTPAVVRFISAEPLLGAIDVEQFLSDGEPAIGGVEFREIDWVICGGESGPGARPMHPDWVRSLRDQCVAIGTPFFFKQWGGWEQVQYLGQDGKPLLKISLPNAMNLKPSHREIVLTRTDVEDRAKSSVNMRRVGKKAAGDLLDGRQWHEFPKGVSA